LACREVEKVAAGNRLPEISHEIGGKEVKSHWQKIITRESKGEKNEGQDYSSLCRQKPEKRGPQAVHTSRLQGGSYENSKVTSK